MIVVATVSPPARPWARSSVSPVAFSLPPTPLPHAAAAPVRGDAAAAGSRASPGSGCTPPSIPASPENSVDSKFLSVVALPVPSFATLAFTLLSKISGGPHRPLRARLASFALRPFIAFWERFNQFAALESVTPLTAHFATPFRSLVPGNSFLRLHALLSANTSCATCTALAAVGHPA